METQTKLPASSDGGNAADEVNPTFTPLKIGADGSRVPYGSPPSFEQLRSDLFAGTAVVIMPHVDMTELRDIHHSDGDPTAGHDGAQAELYCLLELAPDTDLDIARLWLDTHSGEDTGLCTGETAKGEPELAAT